MNMPSDSAPRGLLEWQHRIELLCRAFSLSVTSEVSAMSEAEAATTLNRCSEELFDTILERTLGPAVEMAVCKPGCHRCCSINLEASWYESLAVAIHVDRQMPPCDRGITLRRIERYADEVRGMTSEDRLKRSTMCPFLRDSDGMCSIYPIRPILCRAHYVSAGGECGTGVPVNMLLAPKILASIVSGAVNLIRSAPEGVEPFTEFVTAVLFHTDRLTGRREPRTPVPALGHEIDDKIGPQTVIFDPGSGEAEHD